MHSLSLPSARAALTEPHGLGGFSNGNLFPVVLEDGRPGARCRPIRPAKALPSGPPLAGLRITPLCSQEREWVSGGSSHKSTSHSNVGRGPENQVSNHAALSLRCAAARLGLPQDKGRLPLGLEHTICPTTCPCSFAATESRRGPTAQRLPVAFPLLPQPFPPHSPATHPRHQRKTDERSLYTVIHRNRQWYKNWIPRTLGTCLSVSHCLFSLSVLSCFILCQRGDQALSVESYSLSNEHFFIFNSGVHLDSFLHSVQSSPRPPPPRCRTRVPRRGDSPVLHRFWSRAPPSRPCPSLTPPREPSPNTITLRVCASTYEFGGEHIQFITPPNEKFYKIM